MYQNNLKDQTMSNNQKYYIYVGQLRKEFAKSKKAKLKNENPDPEKHGLYVGYSSKEPKVRWRQHLKKERNSKGPLFSRVAAKWGENYIHWRKFKDINPISSKNKAKKLEREIAIKYRDKGIATWSDALPYLESEN